MAVCWPDSGERDYTAGGEIRDRLGNKNNYFSHCKIKPFDGHAAILYEDPKCEGKNYLIQLEKDKKSTECGYDNLDFLWDEAPKGKGWKEGSVRSIRLSKGAELEAFTKEDHFGHSYTLKNFNLD